MGVMLPVGTITAMAEETKESPEFRCDRSGTGGKCGTNTDC